MIQASLSGRLGKDPKSIPTKTGTLMVSAPIAVDVSSYQGESSVWVSLTAFGKYAELLSGHVKGDTIAASGRLELAHWTDDEGAVRDSWRLIADHLHSARTVRKSGRARSSQRQTSEPPDDAPDAGEAQPRSDALPFDDDIPF
jgi:single-strand DNA-binding protein